MIRCDVSHLALLELLLELLDLLEFIELVGGLAALAAPASGATGGRANAGMAERRTRPPSWRRGMVLPVELVAAESASASPSAPMPSSIAKPSSSSSAAAAATGGCPTGPVRRALWRRPSGPLPDPGASRPGGRGWGSGERLCRRASAMPDKG